MVETVKIGKRSYVIGMKWRSFEKRPQSAELRDDGEKLNSDWVAVRISGGAIQAGFINSVGEVKRPKNLYSLAAAIADAKVQPWLGIFKLSDDLYWYIAIREGQAILPDGDIVGRRKDIVAARERHEGFKDWNFIEGDIDTLSSLISNQGRDLVLTPVRSLIPTSPIPALSAAGVITISLIAGALYWHHYKQVLQQNRLAELAIERAALQKQVLAISPLIGTPAPSTWMSTCQKAVSDIPLTEDGWGLVHVSCSSELADVLWERLPGGTVLARPPGALGSSGDVVEQTIRLKSASPAGDNAAGLNVSNIALYALLQPLGIEATISAPLVPPTLPGSDPQPIQIPQEAVSFTTSIDPFSLNYDSVPGLRITDVVGAEIQNPSSGQNTWMIKGDIYGR